MWRINELLNWQVAAAGEDINVADAASTKVFGTERIQYIGRLAEEIVGKYGNPAEPDTAELLNWLDSQTKRNLVITFGGGVNEVMREMIAASGPQSAEGAAMTECRHPGRRRGDQSRRRRQAARRPGSGEPADDQQLGRGDRRPQPDLCRRGRRHVPSGHPGIVAPPAMIQVWTMFGLGGARPTTIPWVPIMKLFDDAGYIGVVATNCEQTYHRYLQPGEQVSITAEMGDVVGPKQTALGEGYFINQHIIWRVGDEDVAEMNWRILKFKPANPDAPSVRCPRISTPTP